MSETVKPKPKLQGQGDVAVNKPKPRLTGAFRHFQDEMKALNKEPETILTPEKGELVFDDGREISNLEKTQVNGTGLLKLNALNIEPWQYANRSEDALFLEELSRDIDTAGGQKSPVLVRKLATPRPSATDPEQLITHEVIAGRRRWEAVRKRADKTLICMVRDLSDQEAALEQEMENRRKDPSNYDDAKTYKRYLDTGLYPTQQALCDHLGIEKTKLSQLMNYIKLPEEVSSELDPMHKISMHTARILRTYTCNKDPVIREQCIAYTIEHSDKVREGKLSYKQLESAFKKLIDPPKSSDMKRTITCKGRKVCNIKKTLDGKITITLDSTQLPDFLDDEIRLEVNEVLESL
ncbi:ParB/RepB/Spo0J family partition protein [Parendozoicomonas sp. Alg238-R29]|uniref:ParB/RepB/Spo0J family partition protein n=1 Tax=Parendozoicomonas sp. Alg238-R29 TaxID=2993446 RepID=UPI00248EAAC2|nr:ParB/RepB/Spo0J family partition protein [Parendozoicomonas sp. Alg238-R29]